MTDLFQDPEHQFQAWESSVFKAAGLEVCVLRGDLFHPWMQGNKWYKLRHFAAEAEKQGADGFLSIGGAWSNHLLALAYYAGERNLKAHFLIRGSENEWENHPPVEQMRAMGARLTGISRSDFREISSGRKTIQEITPVESGQWMEVPLGASAPETIIHTTAWARHLCKLHPFTDLVLPVASGGTVAGMLAGLKPDIKVHGIDVLGSRGGLKNGIQELLIKSELEAMASLCWHDEFHFGGYAANHPELEAFMHTIRHEHFIPTEHVYSGKAFYAVLDLASKAHFSSGSKILVLHTGGLFQWN